MDTDDADATSGLRVFCTMPPTSGDEKDAPIGNFRVPPTVGEVGRSVFEVRVLHARENKRWSAGRRHEDAGIAPIKVGRAPHVADEPSTSEEQTWHREP